MTQLFTNNAKTRLNAPITDVATSLTVATSEGGKFPNPSGGDFFLVTLFEYSGSTEINHEIVKVTARTGDTFTIERAQEGTTAAAWASLTPVELRVTAATLDDFYTDGDPINTGAITGTSANITGNILVSGTVDGRDVAADGTKLDTIEDNATADQTAGEIEAIVNHDNLQGFVANEHIDWTVDQGATNIDPGNYTDTNTTYVSSDFTHDSLTGVSANEHIDWTVTQAANIHADNYTDTNTTYVSSDFTHNSLSGVSANEHIDWTVDQGATNIHTGNYVNTVYTHPSDGAGNRAALTGAVVYSDVTINTAGHVTGTDVRTLTLADLGYTGDTNANNYSLPEATATARGGIELFSDTDNPTAANSVTSTANRTYGLQLNSAGQGVINVPWTDTNTNTTNFNVQANGGTQVNISAGEEVNFINGTDTTAVVANQANPTVTFNHNDTSTLSGFYGGSGNGIVVEDITVDGRGHVTAIGTVDLDGRFNNYSHPNHTGHVTSSGDGATTLTVSAITGQTATTSLVSTDEMLVNDGGAIRRADISVLQTYMQNNLSFGSGYTHPAYAGDDFSVDTGVLSGATVVSDIDINVTTDLQGHVTDANGSVSTRTLTLANLGYTGATNANNYVHPTHTARTESADTGPLTGATVISDLDFNITVDSLGHVTACDITTVATRNLTAADIGAATSSHNHTGTYALIGGSGTQAFAASTFTIGSDIKLKDVHGEYEYEGALGIKAYVYDLKDGSAQNQVGYLHHETKEVLPYAAPIDPESGYGTVNYTMVHTAKISELETIVSTQQAEIDALRDIVERLADKVEL